MATKGHHQCSAEESQRKRAARLLGNLAGQCEDAPTDHHAGAHRDGTERR
jgi:hypothetical protein